MNTELREAVERIKGGDKVTARFADGPLGEFTVTGSAYEDASGWLRMAGYFFKTRDGEPTRWLVAIEAHEPAKPPVPPAPTPTDDLVLLDERDRPITRYGSAWLEWSSGEYSPWEHLDWPLKVYRPAPSPEHEAREVAEFAEAIAACAAEWDEPTARDMVREFLSNLRGGA
jgi:hypothetical protein